MNVISTFRTQGGGHSFLSNFYESPLLILPNRHTAALTPSSYASAEHFYQAAKASSLEDHDLVLACSTPGEAKRAGRQVRIRDNFLAERLEVMRYVLRHKFPVDGGPLSEMLVETGDAILLEGNTWGDTYWGVCRGKGQNWLGHLLMARRAEVAAHLNANPQQMLYLDA